MKRVEWVASVSGLFAIGLGVAACGTDDSAVDSDSAELGRGGPCTYDGVEHDGLGDFLAVDRCNACRCAKGGVICTKLACVPPGPPPLTACEYGGKTYSIGESFPSTDGCNTCFCDARLSVAQGCM